jgi:cysteine sulfinate desulfinase/cysteine desulfurase-like protein
MYSITLAAWLRAVGLALSSVSSCSNRSAMPGVLLTAHGTKTESADQPISGS